MLSEQEHINKRTQMLEQIRKNLESFYSKEELEKHLLYMSESYDKARSRSNSNKI